MWRQKEQDLCVRKSSVEKGPENVLRERSFSATVLTAHWRLQTADFLREESEGESDVCWRRKEDQCARGSRADGRGGSPLSTHSLIIRTHAGVPLFPLSVPHLPLPNFPTHTLSHTQLYPISPSAGPSPLLLGLREPIGARVLSRVDGTGGRRKPQSPIVGSLLLDPLCAPPGGTLSSVYRGLRRRSASCPAMAITHTVPAGSYASLPLLSLSTQRSLYVDHRRTHARTMARLPLPPRCPLAASERRGLIDWLVVANYSYCISRAI